MSKLLLGLFLCAGAIWAQQVGGRVTDDSGAPHAGATVRLENLDRAQHWTAQSDQQGRFKFLSLPPGAYELRVPRGVSRFTLHAGEVLEVGAMSQTVDVEADAPVVETTRSEAAAAVEPPASAATPARAAPPRPKLDIAVGEVVPNPPDSSSRPEPFRGAALPLQIRHLDRSRSLAKRAIGTVERPALLASGNVHLAIPEDR